MDLLTKHYFNVLFLVTLSSHIELLMVFTVVFLKVTGEEIMEMIVVLTLINQEGLFLEYIQQEELMMKVNLFHNI